MSFMKLMLQIYNIFCFHPNFFLCFLHISCDTGMFLRQISQNSLISVACPEFFRKLLTLSVALIPKRTAMSGNATTAENGEDGPYYRAVLIAYQLTAKSQVGVDYRGQNTVKFV